MRTTTRARLGLALLLLFLLPAGARAAKIQAAISALLLNDGPRVAMAGDRAAKHPASEVCLDARGRLLCWITTEPGSFERSVPGAEFPGLEVEGRLGPYTQVWLPLGEIQKMAGLPGVLHIGLPPRPAALVAPLAADGPYTSEALPRMRVPQFWPHAENGRGVRVGIIDVGFTGYERLLGSELPAQVTARSFYRNGYGESDIGGDGVVHGTACAELVHDVAPEAELYLANVSSPVDLQTATNWMIEQGVEVISHSVGWFFGAGDGTGLTESIAAHARESGILWINAAGNFALGHWTGPYLDVNGNGIAEIGAGKVESLPLPRAVAGEQIWILLLWDRWPYSLNLEFEIALVTDTGALISSSEADPYQDNVYAVRSVSFTVDQTRDDLNLRIRRVSGVASGVHLRLIRGDNDVFLPADRVVEGSMAMPADAPEVLSVGAFAWQSGELEPFSSRGPTTAGLAKPEILGPDGVSTYTYLHTPPPGLFYGTSAACPHVAGLAALILAASPRGGFYDARWTASEVQRLLQENAEPVPDSLAAASGWGRARLPLLASSATAPRLVLAGAPGSGSLRLRLLHAPQKAASVQVFDVLGRLRAVMPGRQIDRETIEYSLESAHGTITETGRYWAREPVTSASVSILWPGRSGFSGSR